MYLQKIITITGILALLISSAKNPTFAQLVVNRDCHPNCLSTKNQNRLIAKRKIDGVLQLFEASNNYIYIIENGRRKWVCNRRTLQGLGFDYKDVIFFLKDEINMYPFAGVECLDGSLLTTGTGSLEGRIFVIKNQQKRWFTSLNFNNLKVSKNDVTVVPAEFLQKIPTGDDIFTP